MRRITEMRHLPVATHGVERQQHRGFLIRLLRALLGCHKPCSCRVCRRRRGEEVEELTLPTIEF